MNRTSRSRLTLSSVGALGGMRRVPVVLQSAPAIPSIEFLHSPPAAPPVALVRRPERSPAADSPSWVARERRGAFELYLDEIGRVPLLTPAQEVELAVRIQSGDESARELMIKSNLRLVVKIARDYDGFGLPLLDLINEGNMGLMKAVEKFDPTKGAKFSTYSSWWIKQSIRRALANQSKTIRIPVHMVDKIARSRRVAIELEKELGREPTDEELAVEMGISLKRVVKLKAAAIRSVSLDAPAGEDETRTIAETVADDRATSAFHQLDAKTRTELVRELVKDLSTREINILRERFGLDGKREKTLDEIGRAFGLTRERIRQVQNEALRKLRRMIEREEATPIPAAA